MAEPTTAASNPLAATKLKLILHLLLSAHNEVEHREAVRLGRIVQGLTEQDVQAIRAGRWRGPARPPTR